jgi:phosphoenolpyruvate-protein kinase (PTS system EI component)
MCGDMAGDPMSVWMLLGLGLRNFSMAPRQIPVVKSIIRSTRLDEAERLAERALQMPTEAETEALVHEAMLSRFPVELTDGDEEKAS